MIARFFRIITLSVLMLTSVFVIGYSGAFYFQNHAKYDYFYEALDALPETLDIVQWTEAQPRGREIADNNRVDFATKITESWQAYAMAMSEGNANYLKDYFASVALERTLYVLESEQTKGANMVMMGMTVEPEVFHIDGSLFQFSADTALFARYMIENDELTAYSFSEDCILSNMIIRQSGWKTSHFERRCSQSVSNALTAPEWDLPKLKGVNYYPKNSPWTFFWQDYNTSITGRDLRMIKRMKANAVRIFLPFETFTNPITSEDARENLENFLEQTQKQELWVIPTLFDFRGELAPWTWSSDRYYLDQVLPVLQAAENIAYVDLKNELDLDDRYQSPALVEAWVRTITALARRLAPDLRYSIGWSNAENAMRYADWLDVISYHDYEGIRGMQARLDKVQSQAGDKPVIVSEIGVSSYDLAIGLPSNEKKQGRELGLRLDQMRNSEGVMVWTLYDFPLLDDKAIAGSFWNKGIQKNFGLLDKFENQKLAAQVFQEWSY